MYFLFFLWFREFFYIVSYFCNKYIVNLEVVFYFVLVIILCRIYLFLLFL